MSFTLEIPRNHIDLDLIFTITLGSTVSPPATTAAPTPPVPTTTAAPPPVG